MTNRYGNKTPPPILMILTRWITACETGLSRDTGSAVSALQKYRRIIVIPHQTLG
jgi:hypothetical protein